MNAIKRLLEKLRKVSAQRSCTCDACGREVFSYPTPRLCEQCLQSMIVNDGFQCEKCGRATRGEGVCSTCKKARPEFQKGASALAYFDFSAMLVNRFKNGKRHLSNYFAEEMEKVLDRLPKREYVLVPVPLTKQKRRLRGYNQAEELALRLSELTGYACKLDLLEKKRDGEQKQRSFQQRRESVVGSFRVTDRAYCKGKDFLLIDDVMTSGATLSEIASRLLRAGAASVCALALSAVPDIDYDSVNLDSLGFDGEKTP